MALEIAEGRHFKYMTVSDLEDILLNLDSDLVVHPNNVGNLSVYKIHDPYEGANESDGALIAEAIDKGYGEPNDYEFMGFIDFQSETFDPVYDPDDE